MQPVTIEEARHWYQHADPVHDFDHVLRVYRVAEHLAEVEGADWAVVQAAALLHDSRGSAPGKDGSARVDHHLTSALFAGEVLQAKHWLPDQITAVQHCIRAHRFRPGGEAPQTLEAMVLFDADKLDVLGAIGAARTIAYAALDGKPIYYEPSEQFLQRGIKELGELHSSYHEYLYKLRHVKERMFTKAGQIWAEKRHAFLTQFYKQLQAEVRGDC